MKVWEIVAIALAVISAALAIIFARTEKTGGRWTWLLVLLVLSAGFSSGHFANNQLTAEDNMPRKKSLLASESLPPQSRPPYRYANPVEQKKFESLWISAFRLSGPPPSESATPVLVDTATGKTVRWEK